MASSIVLILFVVIVAAVIWAIVYDDKRRKEAAEARSIAEQTQVDQAHVAYQESLAALKTQPGDADLKQKALALGRVYANLTRERKGVTIFDEMALMNDINAATAGVTGSSVPGQTPEQRLQRLETLKTQGLISDAEYSAQRTKILSEL